MFVGLVFAVHFWAPTFKWGISIANIADFAKPPEKLSYPQQIGKVPIHPWLCLFHSLCTHIPCMLLCIFSVCKPIAVSTCHARHLASRWEQKLILLLPDSILIILYLLYFTLTFVIWLVSSGHLYWSYMVTLQYCNYTSKFWEPLGPFFFFCYACLCVCDLYVGCF